MSRPPSPIVTALLTVAMVSFHAASIAAQDAVSSPPTANAPDVQQAPSEPAASVEAPTAASDAPPADAASATAIPAPASDSADDDDDAQSAAPVTEVTQDAANEATAAPATEAPPSGMVFDPTTGRYMPVAEQLPWRNSFFIFDNSIAKSTLDPTDSFNRSYWVQTYSLRPRWNFTDTLSLRLRQDLFVEWIATSVSSETQPVVLDTQLDLVEASLFTFSGVIVGVGARVLLPTSLASRNANRVLGTGGSISATRVFSDVMAGLVTQASLGYQRWWATSTTAAGYEPESLCIAGNTLSSCSTFPSRTSIRDTITASALGQLSFTPELSAGLLMSWLWQRGAGLETVRLDADGAGVPPGATLEDQSATHWRNMTLTSIFVSYQVNAWLQASLGLNTLTNQLNGNGNIRNPFWNVETQYSLTAVVTMDQLYSAIVGDSAQEQAHARAKRPGTRL